jgi:hypothetical protein
MGFLIIRLKRVSCHLQTLGDILCNFYQFNSCVTIKYDDRGSLFKWQEGRNL